MSCSSDSARQKGLLPSMDSQNRGSSVRDQILRSSCSWQWGRLYWNIKLSLLGSGPRTSHRCLPFFFLDNVKTKVIFQPDCYYFLLLQTSELVIVVPLCHDCCVYFAVVNLTQSRTPWHVLQQDGQLGLVSSGPWEVCENAHPKTMWPRIGSPTLVRHAAPFGEEWLTPR